LTLGFETSDTAPTDDNQGYPKPERGRTLSEDSASSVTQLLQRWRAGDQQALNRLMSTLYRELHRIASSRMKSERDGHTLQATALVNEAYLRLVDAEISWQDRTHFIAVMATTMRRVLIDHAKTKRRDKRGADLIRVTLDDQVAGSLPGDVDLFELSSALDKLSQLDPRKCQVIELHFFGGLTYDEAAEALGISAATMHRELRLAKAWLARELKDGASA
jgi:RNA polymerase sigma factor (TIGR02999 family)